ncbi:hypothetical protein SETIT_3G142300v2 [Setaria italica]|uniref:KIB1-4 beta-propeller domain-containing protein n=1 Tax=Setaria italica TaxID=4555 RepID=A0A368QER9_SETIT|nr:hypothetical protein SETIT_3G142300v2 [Setaria italica]
MTASRAKRSAPWADLQPELLGLVLRRLPSLADRVRLRAVCHWWRRVARLEEPLLPPPLPWVALHDATFVSLPAGEIHHSFARVRRRVMTALFKLVLPSSGHLSPDSLFAVLFSSDGDSTISVGQAATTTTSFWVPRESITDVAFFDGKLYAISRSNKLFVLDIDSSDEDLTNPCGQWRPVNTLGGQALFVGTHSKSLPASECGAQEDCIYFLSDYDWGYYDKDPFRDCGVFNMRNGMITPMSPKIAAMQTQGNKTGRPAWFFHAEAM